MSIENSGDKTCVIAYASGKKAQIVCLKRPSIFAMHLDSTGKFEEYSNAK